jgi:hypothetical protein
MRKLYGDNLKVGDIVYHDKFDRGEVIHIRKDHRVATIYFDRAGEKDIRVDLGYIYDPEVEVIRDEDIEWF